MPKAFALAFAVLLSASAGAQEPFISAEEAKKLLGNPNVRFVFSDPEKEFAAAHLPGSVVAYSHDLQYLDDVRRCKGLPMCEATAFAFLGKLGIDPGTEVIAYDSGIGVNASGNWFFLKLYGHDKVRILDGGLATWKAKGLPVETGAPAKVAEKKYAGKVRWEMVATRAEVEQATKDPSKYLLLDARHVLDQYSGKELQAGMTSPGKEQVVARGGFIPTAVFSPWTKYAGNKAGDADKPTLRDAKDLAKQLEKLKKHGYAPEKTLISYCHVGLGRGSFQYLALQRAGHANTKLYIGSWAEWGNTPELPLGTTPAD